MSYTLYSAENCTQCNFTKKLLDDRGIDYEPIDIDKQPEAREKLKSEGLMSVPVLKDANDELVAVGFRPEILSTLKNKTAIV